jgi:hypothetical protein
MNKRSKIRVALPLLLAIALGTVLGFFLNGWIVHSETYALVAEALASLQENLILPRIRDPHENQHYYRESRFTKTGVTLYDEEAAFQGATIFSSSAEPAAVLIDMSGTRVHEWRLPFHDAWPKPPHLELPVPDDYVIFRKVHLYPNGDLLAIYEAPGHWPYAYGLVRIDAASKLLWKYEDLANHDLDVAPDGSIYTLVHEVRPLPIEGLEGFPGRFVIDDVLAVIDAEGREVKRVSVIDALLDSKYAPLLLADGKKKDVLHTNSVDVVSTELARQSERFEEGQVLLSLRAKSAIAVLDIPSERIIWARRGSWRQQHAARFVGSGAIGIFDNSGNVTVGGKSRIVEFDIEDGAERWTFSGDDDFEFETRWRGSYQILPNGNRLVTESDAGRIFEIAPDKSVVWEYVYENQIENKTPAVFWAHRFAWSELDFVADRR